MNIFEFLPRPGQSRPLPGGAIWCQEWEVSHISDGRVEGRVVFEFQARSDVLEPKVQRLPDSGSSLPPA